jgi:hypothetical protein
VAVDRGDLLLPRGGARHRVVVAGGPLARKALAADGVLGEHEVEHGGHELAADPHRRHPAGDRGAALALTDVEAREVDGDALLRSVEHRQGGLDAVQAQVPAPGLAVSVADRAVGHGGSARAHVEHDRFPLGVLLLAVEVGRPQHPVGHEAVAAGTQRHQQPQVGEAPRVVTEVGTSRST